MRRDRCRALMLAGAVLWLAAFQAMATATAQEDLEPGRVIERVLGPGESHTYRVACAAGAYVLAVVEQRGVDVVVSVSGPDDSEVLEVDTPTGPTGREGAEIVPFVAARTGLHRVRVRALEANAQGAYAVRLDQHRPATERDRAHFEAHRSWAEAGRLSGRGTAPALRGALRAYEQSGQRLQQLGEDYDAARVSMLAGDLAAHLGETEAAVAHYGRVLSLAGTVGARHFEGLAHLGLGVGHRLLSAPERARDHYQQALEIFQSRGDDRGTGAALTGLAYTQWEDLGEAAEALRLLERALELGRSTRDGTLERAALHNIATIHDWRGEKQAAIELYQKALDLERAAGDRLAVALTLNELGQLFAQWGDYARAGDVHREALELVKAVGNRPQEAATRTYIGRTQLLAGEIEGALASLGAALALSREIKDTALEAHALSQLGEAYGVQGDVARAIEHLRRAVEIDSGATRRYWPARARVQLGRAHLRAGDAGASRQALAEALELARNTEALGIEAAARRELARVALRQGELEAALREAESAVAIVESQRAVIAREDLRTAYFASVHPYYQTHIDALMALHAQQPAAGHAGRALHLSERARARRVLEALVESAVDLRAAADQELVARERALRQELSALASQRERLAQAGAPASRRERAEKKLRQLEGDHQEAARRLKQTSPRQAALVQPPILEVAEIQKELEPGTALLEYALGEERSFLWMVTSTSVAARELPPGAAIDRLARRVHEALSARAPADRNAAQAAAELGRVVLPEDLDLRGLRRLVIVADGALQIVPFATLSRPRSGTAAPAESLVSRFEIVYAPSASWVAALRRLRRAAPPPKTLAVFADPVFDRGDRRVREAGGPAPAPNAILQRAVSEVRLAGRLARLPYSRHEARAAASMVPRGQALIALDFDASRERASSPDLSDFRIVHFATHNLLNDEHPDLSGVVLSLVDRRGQDRDGFLRVQDVYNLRLPAELVVLSGCQSAIGKAVPGEGLMGLARGFMYAGARRVVASLWPVEEVATTELMTAFYRWLLKHKRPPGEALRQAQLELASQPRWRAPYYWAGFVVQGDWSDRSLRH